MPAIDEILGHVKARIRADNRTRTRSSLLVMVRRENMVYVIKEIAEAMYMTIHERAWDTNTIPPGYEHQFHQEIIRDFGNLCQIWVNVLPRPSPHEPSDYLVLHTTSVDHLFFEI